MKAITVPMSELQKHNRWDAQYHIAVKHLLAKEGRATQLQQSIPNQQHAIDLLAAMHPNVIKDTAQILCRGNKLPSSYEKRLALCQEHPYLALALIEERVDVYSAEMKQAVAKEQGRLDAITKLSRHASKHGQEPSL